MSQTYIRFNESIAANLLVAANKYDNHTAIELGDDSYSYKQLFTFSKNLAAQLMRSKSPRCLILCARGINAYIALLAALLSGKAYVFLNHKDTIAQLKNAILIADTDLIISDSTHYTLAQKLNEKLKFILTILPSSKYKHCYETYSTPALAYGYAYIMFTSGSTGMPKGVPISHVNLKSFVTNIKQRIKPTYQAKFSQINELTFDFSVYEIFCCWLSGASLCVLPDNYLYGIDKYINKHQITHWSSVPSIIQLLAQLKKLNTNAFFSIRYSVFCGEVLTHQTVKQWLLAAPNSIIDNLYGPTEATVAICGHIYNKETQTADTIPLGTAFTKQGVYVVDEQGDLVLKHQLGEIYLYGDQVATQYWNSSQQAQSNFIQFNNRLVYKTGDLAIYNEQHELIYKGRKDDQLKLNGYRIEKYEIEMRIKTVLRTQIVALIASRHENTKQFTQLTCFYVNRAIHPNEAKTLCRKHLPPQMLAHKFIQCKCLPYNKNGKVDYIALRNSILLEEVI